MEYSPSLTNESFIIKEKSKQMRNKIQESLKKLQQKMLERKNAKKVVMNFMNSKQNNLADVIVSSQIGGPEASLSTPLRKSSSQPMSSIASTPQTPRREIPQKLRGLKSNSSNREKELILPSFKQFDSKQTQMQRINSFGSEDMETPMSISMITKQEENKTVNMHLEGLFEDQLLAFVNESKIDENRRASFLSKMTGDQTKSVKLNSLAKSYKDRSSQNYTTANTQNKMQGEKEFFKLIVLAEVMRTPQFMMKHVVDVNPEEMFERAKLADTKFFDFNEWVSHEMKAFLYSQEEDFFDLELEYLEKQKKT